MWYLRFSRRWRFKLRSSELWRRIMLWYGTNVSEDRAVCIFMVKFGLPKRRRHITTMNFDTLIRPWCWLVGNVTKLDHSNEYVALVEWLYSDKGTVTVSFSPPQIRLLLVWEWTRISAGETAFNAFCIYVAIWISLLSSSSSLQRRPWLSKKCSVFCFLNLHLLWNVANKISPCL